MNYIDFFKLQAKNLFKDYQTKKRSSESPIGDYVYYPKYFDIHSIILYFDIDEDDFSLMKAQHIIAQIVGFKKWTDMLKASQPELELAKLLFDNQDKISAEDWEMYIHGTEHDNKMAFDPDTRLEIFKQVFVNVDGHVNTFPDYRLHQQTERLTKDDGIDQNSVSRNPEDSQAMIEVFIKDKQKYLNDEYPFEDKPKLSDKVRCLHCGEIVTVGDYKVFKIDSEEYICCPNAPKCNGTIIDWVSPDLMS